MKKIIVFSLGLSLMASLSSCREGDLDPTLAQDKQLTEVKNQQDLAVFVNGIYSIMRDVNYLGRDYQIYGEVRSDNAYSNGNSNRFIIESSLEYTPDQGQMPASWYRMYQVIGRANFVINSGVEAFTGDKKAIEHYIGQAYIARAMAHFDLVRIFGQHYVDGQGGMNALGVPYVKLFKGDPANPYPARNTVQEVYDFAVEDLNEAIKLMDVSLDDSSSSYFTSASAWALMSRMAIYFGDYSLAEKSSDEVIKSGKYTISTVSNYVNTWKSKGASNWIFALYSNTSNESLGNNSLARIYRLPSSGVGYGDVVGLGNLYDLYEASDIRRSSDMFTSKTGAGAGEFRVMGKFPDVANGGDAIPVIRYEEVVLNYAEALFNNGKVGEALIWLNKIPSNRGASIYTNINMDNILKERRKEFCFEGFRFHDLVRTQKGVDMLDDTRQRMKKSVPYGDYRLAFPIPRTEMNVNANMKQNKNYQ
ncbi:RagB/SusD family nutrient uptake outer membrane protein [Riemerella anatipestifer]|nr:RagB/SusD family nutrient uptake outer membrane protein [Riemerella anatipestifer]